LLGDEQNVPIARVRSDGGPRDLHDNDLAIWLATVIHVPRQVALTLVFRIQDEQRSVFVWMPGREQIRGLLFWDVPHPSFDHFPRQIAKTPLPAILADELSPRLAKTGATGHVCCTPPSANDPQAEPAKVSTFESLEARREVLPHTLIL